MGASSPHLGHQKPWLDIVRALAALAVLLSHVRALVLRDAADQPPLGTFGRAMFGLSGLGHEAVIVFFVLSGFLVAGSMRRLIATGRWSLLRFGLDRLSRLWLVLIPCLILGGLCDRIGLSLTHSDPTLYGRLALTTPHAGLALDEPTLLGNLLFLQTVVVPVYGSNGPLWSLADEAWFYAVAALAVSAVRNAAKRIAVLPAAALVLLVAWLPIDMLALFPVWLCGAGALLVRPAKRDRVGGVVAAFGTIFAAALVASRLHVYPAALIGDWSLAVATALLIRHLAALPCPDAPAWRPLLRLSAMSYTLYLSHLPLLALLGVVVIGPQRMIVGPGSAIVMLVAALVALAWAAVLSWLFERHTPALRRLALRTSAKASRLVTGHSTPEAVPS